MSKTFNRMAEYTMKCIAQMQSSTAGAKYVGAWTKVAAMYREAIDGGGKAAPPVQKPAFA